jgi:hypothetical protein
VAGAANEPHRRDRARGPAPVNESAEQMEVIAALAKELNSAEGRTRLGKFRTVIARAAREDRQDR